MHFQQHPVILEIIEKSCKYASLYSAEAAMNLLEHGGCQHIDDPVDPDEVTIDHWCRDNVSHMLRTVARRIVSEYWMAHGCEYARVQAAMSLEMVCSAFLIFICARTFLLFFVQVINFLVFAGSQSRAEPREQFQRGAWG